MTETNELMDFALRLAKAAEEEIMPFYYNHTVEMKPDGTEVTEADKRAESKIVEMIQRHFPEHAFLGEETGSFNNNNNSSGYKWIVDPLDGTSWFTLGMPVFGTLIALLKDNEPYAGVIHFPALGETTYAIKGEGCRFKTRNGDRVVVRVSEEVVGVKDAVLSASGIHGSDIRRDNDDEIPYNLVGLIRKAKKFKFCSDCMQYALVSRARLHGALDTLMNPWDIAALVPCIEEAGGVISSLSGKRENIVFGGSLVAASNRTLHREIIETMQPLKT